MHTCNIQDEDKSEKYIEQHASDEAKIHIDTNDCITIVDDR